MTKIEVLENGNVKLTIPMSFRHCAGRKRIVVPDDSETLVDPLVLNLARAFRWQELIDSGTYSNAIELARAVGKDTAYVARTIRLTLLAPEIVHAILHGTLKKSISMETLRKSWPENWEEHVDEYFSQKTEECGGNAVLGFLKGVKDGILGIDEWIYNNVVFPFMDGLLRGLGIDTGYSKETYTVGDEVVTGFFKGGKDKIDEYKNWVKETFVDPFLDKLRLNFLISGGDGASAIMQTIGQCVMQGFFLGLKGKWSSEIAPWLTKKAQALKDLFKGIFDSLRHPESKRQLDFGIPVDLYAEGGQPKAGSLFIAGEAGAELVGQVGGRTTVTTHDQFSQGMSDIMENTNTIIMQMGQAVVQAILSKDMTVITNISDRAIVNAYDRGKRLSGTGLATGSGIV